MSETTIQLAEQNPEDTDRMAQYESPNGDAICGSYVSRDVAEKLGAFAALTISEAADVMADRTSLSGSGTGNYAVFETPGGAVTGLYISHETWADALDTEVERNDEGEVTNAPESIGLSFAPSDEETFEEAVEEEEDNSEEVEGLIAGDSDESDDEEEVEISDEELDLVDA